VAFAAEPDGVVARGEERGGAIADGELELVAPERSDSLDRCRVVAANGKGGGCTGTAGSAEMVCGLPETLTFSVSRRALTDASWWRPPMGRRRRLERSGVA